MGWAIAALLAFALPATAQTVPQFQVDPFWPKPLPNNWIFGQVASVAVDSKGNVFTGEVDNANRIQKFKPNVAP